MVWERKEKTGFIELFDGQRYYVFSVNGRTHRCAPTVINVKIYRHIKTNRGGRGAPMCAPLQFL